MRLRAYTPREQKAVRTAADTFRPNPDFDCASAITQLGVGEALVSTLENKGVPSMVQRTLIRPPASRVGPITAEERRRLINESPVAGQYDQAIDRESAFEMLQKKAERARRWSRRTSRRRRRAAERAGRCRISTAAIRGPLRREGPAAAPAAASGAGAEAVQPADGRRGGDQVGGSHGRRAGRPRAGARHSGKPEQALRGAHTG